MTHRQEAHQGAAGNDNKLQELTSIIEAVSKSQAMIEFNMDGTIIFANENFCQAMGYTLAEIKGKHHSMFATAELRDSAAYREFWVKLNRGEFSTGEYKRVGKHGKEVWIQASYNPILDTTGRPYKVIKFASDITQEKIRNADYMGQVAAISKSQAVIEFKMDGTIIHANDNFCEALGYRLEEIQGKHHSMFAPPELKRSSEYSEFWAKLNRGDYAAGEYKRIGKGGKIVWIQASYNPIMDLNGKPFKVVKYATDITEQRQNFEEILKVADHLAQNDLTCEIEKDYTGQYAQVKAAINKASDNISTVLTQVARVTETVAESVNGLQSSSQDLSVAAEEQSAAVEEVSATLAETDSQVQSNAENANLAKQLTKETANLANQGQAKMQGMTSAMKAIADSSSSISKIIKVIDDIAFQTNLLALNAAVEAARAGQHGKGFAVVAQEVRNLAARSAKAAKETSELIEDSGHRVHQGVSIADETSEALAEIVNNIVKVNDIITEIAAASEEQSNGISQVNQAVNQVNKAASTNSQKSQELSSVSVDLKSLTDQLRAQIGQFTLKASVGELNNDALAGLSPETIQQMMLYLQSQSA